MTYGAVVCVATNGYDKVYPNFIRSQKRYASKHDFDYVLLRAAEYNVAKPDAAWVKIELLLEELRRGADWVMLIDADCKIQRKAPAMWTVEESFKDIYAVRGHSGRWNSGVLIVRNGPDSLAAVERIRASIDTPVAEDTWGDWTDWGENGHVIHELDKYDGAKELSMLWNNAVNLAEHDYIRHHTGPMSLRGDALYERRKAKQLVIFQPLRSLEADRDERLARLAGMAERATSSKSRKRS